MKKTEPVVLEMYQPISQDNEDREVSFETNIKTPRSVSERALMPLNICAVILGLLFGLVGRAGNYSEGAITFVSLPGEIFVRMLNSLVVPIITSSLIVGLSQLSAMSAHKIGRIAIAYCFATTLAAIFLAVIVASVVRPGMSFESVNKTEEKPREVSVMDELFDMVRNAVPDNFLRSAFDRAEGVYIGEIGRGQNYTEKTSKRSLVYRSEANILGLVTFCAIFGALLSQRNGSGEPVIRFFEVILDICSKLTTFVMWLSPFGTVSLIIGQVMSADKKSGHLVAQLSSFIFTLVIGLVIHSGVTLPVIYYKVTGKNPLRYFRGVAVSLLTALATASNIATLPVILRCLEDSAKIDKKIARLTAPLMVALNGNGSALFDTVTAIFIAQLNQVSLNIGDILVMTALIVLTSARPASSSISNLVIILTVLGLPCHDVSLLIALEGLHCRLRTSVDVLGNVFGAAVVEQLALAAPSN